MLVRPNRFVTLKRRFHPLAPVRFRLEANSLEQLIGVEVFRYRIPLEIIGSKITDGVTFEYTVQVYLIVLQLPGILDDFKTTDGIVLIRIVPAIEIQNHIDIP